MCGIAGILNLDNQPINKDTLEKMRNKIRHRGPDGNGIWHQHQIGFTHNRLAIIDTSESGHQPMHTRDGKYTIVFNGEIYNYKELRNDIEARGISLSTQSDTEVLLNLYVLFGSKILNRLNGIFAFAIWDDTKQQLFIARDRTGVKPLYYYKNKHSFTFASEPKAIFETGIQKEINTDNLNEWLLYRYVAGEETLYKNIKRLLPGYCMQIDSTGKSTMQRWWHLGEQSLAHPTIKNPIDWFDEKLTQSVKYRMISGGLDSSSIAHTLYRSGFKQLHAFNVSFRNKEYDESTVAKKFSTQLDYTFHSTFVENENLFNKTLEATNYLDAPLTHANDPHLLAIAEVSKQFVKVLLSGEGADETMGGYVRYKSLQFLPAKNIVTSLLSLLPQKLKNSRIQKLQQYFKLDSTREMIHYNSSNSFPSDLIQLGLNGFELQNPYRNNILQEAFQVKKNNVLAAQLYYDQHTYLPSVNDRNDAATMGMGIECREPFQDYQLMAGLGSLNVNYLMQGKKGKYPLYKLMQNRLPQYILNQPKMGFGVPWYQVLQSNSYFNDSYNNFLQSSIFELFGFDTHKIKTEHFIDSNHRQLMVQLYFFYLWYTVCFNNKNVS
jgi:asparagine synthase (glutamine-hydrolysing)